MTHMQHNSVRHGSVVVMVMIHRWFYHCAVTVVMAMVVEKSELCSFHVVTCVFEWSSGVATCVNQSMCRVEHCLMSIVLIKTCILHN